MTKQLFQTSQNHRDPDGVDVAVYMAKEGRENKGTTKYGLKKKNEEN